MNIRPEFKVHMLNAAGKEKAAGIAEGFSVLLDGLNDIVGTTADPVVGRAWSLAKTHLEEACFYAKKAMASQPENQE